MAMFGKAREVFVYNKSKETFLSFRVKVADSFASRLIGLLGERSLKPDGGVWIVPANSIHTVGMLFSFDLVMIDKDFRVVNLKEMVRPFRIVLPKLRAESVIELPAHTIFRSRTQVGDQLIIDRYESKILSSAGKFAVTAEKSAAYLGSVHTETGAPPSFRALAKISDPRGRM
jgi:uncharacterized membrane protein (UPF0127 family)